MERTICKEAMVLQKTEYMKYCYCDRCKKMIWKRKCDGKFWEVRDKVSVRWYEVTTGHHDWGNDSCESIEHKTICPNCLTETYANYVERANNGKNTEYIEIKHDYGWSLPLVEGGEEDETDN